MKDITDRLKRRSEIAQLTFEKKDWSKCSLLHSFGDKLSRDLEEAIRLIKELRRRCEEEPILEKPYWEE
jgi:hypothetical protein